MSKTSKTAPGAELPTLVSHALDRMHAREPLHGACGWTWTHSDSDSRLAVDEWLVANKHSLAKHLGTRETRFVLLVDMEYTSEPPLW